MIRPYLLSATGAVTPTRRRRIRWGRIADLVLTAIGVAAVGAAIGFGIVAG